MKFNAYRKFCSIELVLNCYLCKALRIYSFRRRHLFLIIASGRSRLAAGKGFLSRWLLLYILYFVHLVHWHHPVNNRNTRIRFEICLKLTIKTAEQHQWRCPGIFIIHFEHVSHLFSSASVVNFEHVNADIKEIKPYHAKSSNSIIFLIFYLS